MYILLSSQDLEGMCRYAKIDRFCLASSRKFLPQQVSKCEKLQTVNQMSI